MELAALCLIIAALPKLSLGEDHPSRRYRAWWSSWSAWSPCSTTCGQGIRSRRRDCVTKRRDEVSRVALRNCRGYPHEHYLCTLRDCSKPTLNFYKEQCTSKNRVLVYGGTYEWVPASSARNDCELRCRSKNYGFLYNFGKMRDGTPCGQSGNDLKHVCIKGHCSRVGCDGKVGSTEVLDQCKICGGRNHNCLFYSNVFRQQWPDYRVRDYTKVAIIPKGATHVKIEEDGSNYLALADSKKQYFLNGNLRISRPGDYPFAGTMFNYNVTYYHEVITAEGPLTVDVHLMLIFRRKNPGVHYEYWTPLDRHPDVQNNTKMFNFYQDQLLRRLESGGRDANASIPAANDTTITPSTTARTGITGSAPVKSVTAATPKVFIHTHNPGHVYRVIKHRDGWEYRYGDQSAAGGQNSSDGAQGRQQRNTTVFDQDRLDGRLDISGNSRGRNSRCTEQPSKPYPTHQSLNKPTSEPRHSEQRPDRQPPDLSDNQRYQNRRPREHNDNRQKRPPSETSQYPTAEDRRRSEPTHGHQSQYRRPSESGGNRQTQNRRPSESIDKHYTRRYRRPYESRENRQRQNRRQPESGGNRQTQNRRPSESRENHQRQNRRLAESEDNHQTQNRRPSESRDNHYTRRYRRPSESVENHQKQNRRQPESGDNRQTQTRRPPKPRDNLQTYDRRPAEPTPSPYRQDRAPSKTTHNPQRQYTRPPIATSTAHTQKSSDRRTSNAGHNEHANKTPSEPRHHRERPARRPSNHKHTQQRPNRRTADQSHNNKKCGPCSSIKMTRQAHYCNSDFVVRAIPESIEVVGNETRYSVFIMEVLKTTKNLGGREIMWARNPCRCPRLRVSKQYLLMGKWREGGVGEDFQAELTPASFVKRLRPGVERRVTSIMRRIRCAGDDRA